MSDSPLASELDRLAALLAEAIALPPTDREILHELRARLRKKRLSEFPEKRKGARARKTRIGPSAASDSDRRSKR